LKALNGVQAKKFME